MAKVYTSGRKYDNDRNNDTHTRNDRISNYYHHYRDYHDYRDHSSTTDDNSPPPPTDTGTDTPSTPSTPSTPTVPDVPAQPSSPSPVITSFTGGPYYTDALISGQSWTGSVSKAAEVHYTYATVSTSNDSSEGVSNPSMLSSSQQAAMDKAFQAWENVANIDFVKDSTASSNTDIIVRQSDLSSGSGVTYTWWQGSSFTKADIILDNAYIKTTDVGSYGFMTMMHEIGHSLGLKHPGNYDSGTGGANGPYLPTSEDSLNNSIMSYNKGAVASSQNPPATPMIYDIAAAQLLYGANSSYNSGDTTYTLNGTKLVSTLWDGNGKDTLSAATYSGNSTIDLREGINNITKVGQSTLWVAFNSNIENATTGTGSDTIYGNSLHNILTGGAGNDTLTGGAGNDIFVFHKGDGKDVITDFQHHSGANGDTIWLDSSIYSSVTQLISNITSSSNGAMLNLGSDTITLTGVSAGTLTAEDFYIA